MSSESLNFAGADLATVVVDDLEGGRLELADDLLGLEVDLVVLAGGHEVHVGRGDLARPAEPLLVVVALGDGCDGPRDADSVGAHRDGHELADLVEDLEPECLGVLLASWKMWPISMPRAASSWCPQLGLVTRAHLGGLDRAVGGEVTARDQVDDVAAGLVGAGDPPRAVDDARVDEEADAGGFAAPSTPGPICPLTSFGWLLEVLEDGRDGGVELGPQPLLVDVAVTGDADREDLLRPVGRGHRDQNVLEGVPGHPAGPPSGSAR